MQGNNTKPIIGYKLFNLRKDGTIGPLFINRKLRVPVGEWMQAENHPTKGYAVRPGWHACLDPIAPHLSEKGRVWCKVELVGVETFDRSSSQGNQWLLAKWLKVVEVCTQ